jgi:hypothetical protein
MKHLSIVKNAKISKVRKKWPSDRSSKADVASYVRLRSGKLAPTIQKHLYVQCAGLKDLRWRD